MQCADCRESVSAGLDGEDGPGEAAAVDEHLRGCGACRTYAEDAARITRLTRTRLAEDLPDLTQALLPRWTAPRRSRHADTVRLGLAGVAVGQVALAIAGATAAMAPGHHDDTLTGASMAHLGNESSAWNLALGVAFGWVAGQRHRPVQALLPVVAAFVAVLTVLSVVDLVLGRVDPQRLLGHGLVVTGLGLLLVHRRLSRDGGGSADRATEPRPASRSASAAPAAPAHRYVDGLDPTGRSAA